MVDKASSVIGRGLYLNCGGGADEEEAVCYDNNKHTLQNILT